MSDLGYLILRLEIHLASHILLDVDNLNALINYFQTFYVNSTGSFELKGMCITEMYRYEQNSAREVMCKAADDDQPNNHSNTNINANNCVNLRCCCAV